MYSSLVNKDQVFRLILGRKVMKFGEIIVRTIEDLWEKGTQEWKKGEKKDIFTSKKTPVSSVSHVSMLSPV